MIGSASSHRRLVAHSVERPRNDDRTKLKVDDRDPLSFPLLTVSRGLGLEWALIV